MGLRNGPEHLFGPMGVGWQPLQNSTVGRTVMPGGTELIIVLIIVALLFGGSKLPKLARSLGSAKGEFEKGLKEGEGKGSKGAAESESKATDASDSSDS
jgi:sec-independent protein translocase protein TatA